MERVTIRLMLAVLLGTIMIGCSSSPKTVAYVHPRPETHDLSSDKRKEFEAWLGDAWRTRLGVSISLSPENPRHLVPYSPLDPHGIMYDIELIDIATNGDVRLNINGVVQSATVGEWFVGSGSSGVMLVAADPNDGTAKITARWIYTNLEEPSGSPR